MKVYRTAAQPCETVENEGESQRRLLLHHLFHVVVKRNGVFVCDIPRTLDAISIAWSYTSVRTYFCALEMFAPMSDQLPSTILEVCLFLRHTHDWLKTILFKINVRVILIIKYPWIPHTVVSLWHVSGSFASWLHWISSQIRFIDSLSHLSHSYAVSQQLFVSGYSSRLGFLGSLARAFTLTPSHVGSKWQARCAGVHSNPLCCIPTWSQRAVLCPCLELVNPSRF